MDRIRVLCFFACLPLLLAAAGQGNSCRSGAGTGNRQARGANSASALPTGRASNQNGGDSSKGKMNSNSEEKSARVAAGVWGGNQARLMVREDGANVVYGCARGTLDAPLALDGSGRFSVAGTHVRERPGPIRLDVPPPASRPARYTGVVEGETMTLSVTLTDESEEVGTFTLTRGSGGRVRKCR